MVKNIMLVIMFLVCTCAIARAETNFYKAVELSQLALDEQPQVLVHADANNKVFVLYTTKNVYLLVEPTTVGQLYTITKINLPTLVSGELVEVFLFDRAGKLTGLQTNKAIYVSKIN